jgi:ribulose-5-phosphate 4-epimerase/fuculose-1-phosphate aldolase
MDRLVRKYVEKLSAAGLTEADAPVLGMLDADVIWNRSDRVLPILEGIFDRLNINSLLFSEPAEPYRAIIDYLASRCDGEIVPRDTETRTFFHSLPVVAEFTPEAIAAALRGRKSAIVRGKGIVTFGTVSPEQAFVTYSSVCFSCFVKFFADYLADRRRGAIDKEREAIFERAAAPAQAGRETQDPPALARGPFDTEDGVLGAMEECGLMTVRSRLVDSYFGNISYLMAGEDGSGGGTLFISQTGSSLDELQGAVDPCPMDGSSCAGITASSELSAHRDIVLNTGNRAVLHGHPKFSVILSMDCDRTECPGADTCHKACPHERFVADIPIVSGEVGTGPFGLCRTVPPAIAGRRGVIVYGHGVFTGGKIDFNEAFGNLLGIEQLCREEYFRRLEA